MKLLGFEIVRTEKKALSPVPKRGGWWPVVFESFPGAWQRNVEVKFDSVLSNHADFACRTLIASDISKLRIKLVKKDADGIWEETTNSAYSPVLRKPNSYQNRIQFFESWVLSKLQRGNAYILKERDARGVVKHMYVLEPTLVRALVSEDGSVFYELNADALAGVRQQIVVPASEMIHDRFNTFFHPLVGLSPIFAAGLAAMQGLAIQNDSATFFQNGAQPGGVLAAPGAISNETAQRLKDYWDNNFSGKNAGKVAVLGDGLKYEAMRSKAVDAQLIEQLKWTAQTICGVYHVPAFMAGVGPEPNYNNVQNLTLRYYSQCLQVLFEAIELCLDEGLGMDGVTLGTEFDTDELLRMDEKTLMDVLEQSKGKLTVNEQRRRLNRKPVAGGDTVYLQEQDHSLEWLSRRDAQPLAPPDPVAPAPETMDEDSKRLLMRAALRKELGLAA